MGTATSEETLESFREVHGKLDFLHNMLQISMDGPKVNWKMIDLIKEEKREFDSEKPALLNIGSCGLHVSHVASALSTTDWKLDKFLKACYSIFKKSPARRADYLRSNDLLDFHDGKDTAYLFRMKYCGHRWLETSRVINRVIEILPYLKTYIKHLNRTKKFPAKDDRFVTLKSMLFSQTLLPSLEFTRCT